MRWLVTPAVLLFWIAWLAKGVAAGVAAALAGAFLGAVCLFLAATFWPTERIRHLR